jgi:hypothetical protein
MVRCLALLLMLVAPPARAQDCAVRDFLTEPLPAGADPAPAALTAAYPGLVVSGGTLTVGDVSLPFAPARGLTGAAALEDATIGDQFGQTYPLGDGIAERLTPWFDPGRARSDALFRALWFPDESSARASLTTVTFAPTGAAFAMTTRHCVAVQLQAALSDLAAVEDPALTPWFTDVGGSFNWRVIAGTDRLSAHSFGTAIDLNADLGGYWRWSGAAEGAVGGWDSAMPPGIVAALERRGFIWGGKWHHFDGMHFEYRPELILFARMVAD